MLERTLDHFFSEIAPLDRGAHLLVAFSGGPDSTALLRAAAGLGSRRGFAVTAAHLDHALDPDSPRRARRAAALAESIGVALTLERLDPPGELERPARGLEDWARRARYAFLERCRAALAARYIATAHHRDDQIETLLLRLLLGSGIEGLGGIGPRRGALVRPLLGLGRQEIATELARYGLVATDDPTNRDWRRPRNLVRDRIAPWLLGEHPELGDRLVRIAATTRRLSRSLERSLSRHLSLAAPHHGASLDLERFRALDPALRPFALSLLHRSAGLTYPAGAASRDELERQIRAGGRIGCDCGGGWRWEGRAGRLTLQRVAAPTPPFAYTLSVPGEVAIPELKVRVSIAREPVAEWMFKGHPKRAALDLPIDAGDRLTVRNRRPGDRLRPLGCGYDRRLKDVLIDRSIPREQRDRIPLLCLDEQVVWVPGLTIEDTYRIENETHVWIASIESTEETG